MSYKADANNHSITIDTEISPQKNLLFNSQFTT